MPARSNDFQRLIALIEGQLAPANATVSECAMMPDTHDGTRREVDILVTISAGERTLRIGIECRDHKRRADLPWIEQVKSKYDLLEIDRCVTVSRRGFSKAALVRARLYNIETLTLSAAQNVDWAERLRRVVRLEVTQEHYQQVPLVELTIKTQPNATASTFPSSKHLILHHASGQPESLQAYVDRMLAAPEIKEKATSIKPASDNGQIFLFFVLKAGCTIEDTAGRRWELERITASMQYRKYVGNAQLEHAVYSSSAVAIGKGEVAGRPFSVAYTQRPGEAVRGRVVIHAEGSEQSFDLPEPFPDP